MFYRVLGPSAAENFSLAMSKNVVFFFRVFALREGENRKKLSRKIFSASIA